MLCPVLSRLRDRLTTLSSFPALNPRFARLGLSNDAITKPVPFRDKDERGRLGEDRRIRSKMRSRKWAFG